MTHIAPHRTQYGSPWVSNIIKLLAQPLGRNNLRFPEQELLVLNRVPVPSTEEHGPEPMNQSLLRRQSVDGMRPKLRDQLDDRMGTFDNTGVRSVVDSEVEGLGLGAPLRVRAGIRLNWVQELKLKFMS